MAAQALLTRELTRLSVNGRKRLVESWSAFLPTLLDPALSIFGSRALIASMNTTLGTTSVSQPPPIPHRRGEKALPDPTVNGEVNINGTYSYFFGRIFFCSHYLLITSNGQRTL